MEINLHPEESILTQSLKNKIVEKIGTNYISVSDFMGLALYQKDYGYYNNLLHKFGEAGDFITAPMVSSVFASCIANQFKELFSHLEDSCNILEIGAGNGQLMLDLLLLLGNEISKYYVLELSSNLIQLQKDFIKQKAPNLLDKIIWLDSLPQSFVGIIFANEVLDAQPCDIIVWDNGNISERVVCLDANNDFLFKDIQVKSPELLKIAQQIIPSSKNHVSEISLNNRGFIKSLSDTLAKGFILLIDYGHSQNEYYSEARANGTLRGFFRHQLLDNILMYPGLIDITTNVDFTAVATTAIDNKLDFIGYTTQSSFLLNCGLLDIVANKHKQLTEHQYLKLTNQVNYLTSPNEMGEVFKVIGFSRGIDVDEWFGFIRNDRSYTL